MLVENFSPEEGQEIIVLGEGRFFQFKPSLQNWINLSLSSTVKMLEVSYSEFFRKNLNCMVVKSTS